MHIYNWNHSDVTSIHYVHEYVTVSYRAIPLLFAFPLLHSLLLPIRLPLLTWNPPCCDRILPPRSQVARKLIFPFPSPCSYTPHSKIPTPRGFPDPNIHSLGRHRESGLQDPAHFLLILSLLNLYLNLFDNPSSKLRVLYNMILMKNTVILIEFKLP
jgi:hypothetical protein